MTAIITKPGIYEMPEDDYHADPVPDWSLSASGAKLLLDLPHLALDVVGNAGRDVDRPEDLPCEE